MRQAALSDVRVHPVATWKTWACGLALAAVAVVAQAQSGTAPTAAQAQAPLPAGMTA